MSTPPQYTSRAGLHDEEAPPPYSPPQKLTTTHQSSPPGHDAQPQLNGDLPFAQELHPSSSAHPATYTRPRDTQSAYQQTAAVLGTSPPGARKSRWQQLKDDNERRKAKKVHVTHDQAARLLGHDEEWLREREMGEGRNAYVRHSWVTKDDRYCAVM